MILQVGDKGLATKPQSAVGGLLGDTTHRDYSRKLSLFNRHAEPELRAAIAALGLRPGMRVLDAGCGAGEALEWLAQQVGAQGTAVGFDLSAAHTSAARRGLPGGLVVQANLLQPPFPARSFDLVWCINTVNHVQDPVRGVAALKGLLRPGGQLAVGQSSLLPEMYFAWDARLERLTNAAVRRYYQQRYALSERELAHVRGLVGWLRTAGLANVRAHTVTIERTTPLAAADEAYLVEAIFRGTWGERLRPYMDSADYAQLERLCDPADPQFALRRPDFHFLHCLTLVTGSA